MAEGTSNATVSQSSEEHDRELCAVCLEPYVHPARLPCGHVFCFLCIKGTANRSKRCAMCRQEIPHDFIEKPNLVEKVDDSSHEGNYQWYYEGRNGWWQYDERASKELETAYKNGERSCELLVAGFLYVMDLEAMLQLRRNDPSRRRRIKRDLANIDKIGIAGLRCSHSTQMRPKSAIREMTHTGMEASPGDPARNLVESDSDLTDSDLTESDDDSQRTIICDPPINNPYLNLTIDEDAEEHVG